MENKKIAIALVLICFMSLMTGIFSSINSTKKEEMPETSNQENVKGILSSHKQKIALITLDGAIESSSNKGFMDDLYTASGVMKALKKAQDDKSVVGVLLKVNSPGGTVAMSQELYGTILRLRKEKPVVVSMGDVAASGGYYIASAADRIFASEGTITGSIGVIFSTYDAHSLLGDKLGITSNVVKSGKFKDIGSSNRPMTNDERKLIQSLVNNSYQQFLAAITKGRINRNDNYTVHKSNLTPAILKTMADGRVFTGEQAQKLGFVDDLGGTYEAHQALINMVKQDKLIKSKDIPLVPYNKVSSFNELFFGTSDIASTIKGASSSILPFSSLHSRTLLYMWE